jgi:hypothetical protein
MIIVSQRKQNGSSLTGRKMIMSQGASRTEVIKQVKRLITSSWRKQNESDQNNLKYSHYLMAQAEYEVIK